MMTAPMPILAAVYRGDRAAAERLVAAGADVRAREVRARSDNHDANTALHGALAGRGDLRIVGRLLACGADVNARAAGGYTPLHVAAFRDDVPLIDTLLAHSAGAAVRRDDGRTALTIAEEQGHVHVARRLRGEWP
jgi:ankyrin repeat protein